MKKTLVIFRKLSKLGKQKNGQKVGIKYYK